MKKYALVFHRPGVWTVRVMHPDGYVEEIGRGSTTIEEALAACVLATDGPVVLPIALED